MSRSPNGGVKFIRNKQILRVRLPQYPAYFGLLATTAFVAFIELFPILIFSGGFHPRLSTARNALLIAYGLGLANFLRHCWWNHSGRWDLVIDYNRQTVELPPTFGRKTRLQINLSDIIHLKTATRRQNEDDSSYLYYPTLSWQNGNSARGKLATFYKESKSERFVEWLRPLLKINDASEEAVGWKSAIDKT